MDDEWRCRACGQHYVVPVLARDCERKHEEFTDSRTQPLRDHQGDVCRS